MKQIILIIMIILYSANLLAEKKDTLLFQKQLNNLRNADSSANAFTQRVLDSLNASRSDIESLKKSKAVNGKDLITWFFSITAFIISVKIFRRDVSFRNIAFVTESNKMKITDPSLWGFYDEYRKKYTSLITVTDCNKVKIDGEEEFEITGNGKIDIEPISGAYTLTHDENPAMTLSESKEITYFDKAVLRINGKVNVKITPAAQMKIKSKEDGKLDDKIMAYCFYKLNSFDLVFKYNNKSFYPNTEWENYMIDSLLDSSIFRQITKTASEGMAYNKDYCQKLSDFLLIVDYVKKQDNTETKRKIVKSRERILLAHKSNCINIESDISLIEKYFD